MAGCQNPDACEWEWWPDHCQCSSPYGSRKKAPEPLVMRERKAASQRTEAERKRAVELERALHRVIFLAKDLNEARQYARDASREFGR